MELQFLDQLRSGETATGKCREETDLDGREQNLGAPKTKGSL
jgi:hypothetical protein